MESCHEPAPELSTERRWLWLQSHDKFIMPYSERLKPWVLVRLLPNMKRVIVAQ